MGDDACRKELVGLTVGVMTFIIFFGTCFCYCCFCCCCCSCCRRKEKPDERYGPFCAMNFIAPRPTKAMKENNGRRGSELPTLPSSQGQAFSATDDLNKYRLSKAEQEAIRKAKEKEEKKEEEEILTRPQSRFGEVLAKRSEEKKQSGSEIRRAKKDREALRKEANEARKKKVEDDKEERLEKKEEEREAKKKAKEDEKKRKQEEKEKAAADKQKAKEEKEKAKEDAIIAKQEEEKKK